MVTYQQQKQQVLGLFHQAISLSHAQKQPDIQKHLVEAQKHLAEGKLFVVVCGEFKQGKSSLLNALLNEPGLFPVDIDITTNLVSTITYGKEEKITVVLGEPGKEQTKKIQRSDIADYVTEQGNEKNAKKARMLVIESPNPQLKEGLVLVDTPGAGSLNIEHTAITYAFIPNADAILFVTDALKPLTTEELNFLKERILPHCQNLIFVVTKIDTVSDGQQIVANNREKLAQVLNCTPEKITIVPVSSRAKLDYLEYEESEDLQYSNFPELENQVWQLIGAQRGQTFLLRAVNELAQSVGEMKAPLQVAWEAHQEHTKEELDVLEAQIKDTQLQLQELLNNNAEWRTILSDELQEIQLEIQGQFQKEFAHIRYKSNQYLDDTRLMNSPKQIASLVETDVDVLMSNLSKELNSQAADLYARLETLTGLNLSRFEVGLSERQKARLAQEEIQSKKSNMVDKSMTATRNAMFNSTAGSVLGGLLGVVAGGVVGILTGGTLAVPAMVAGAEWGASLGLVGGAAKGVKDGISQIQEKDQVLLKREVSKVIALFIEDSQRICHQTLTKAVKGLEHSMRDEFTAQIKRQKQGWEKTLLSLQKSRKLSQVEAVKRTQELQAPLQQLTNLQNSVEQVTQAIVKQPTTISPLETEIKTETLKPTPVTSSQSLASVAASTNADYGDWADE